MARKPLTALALALAAAVGLAGCSSESAPTSTSASSAPPEGAAHESGGPVHQQGPHRPTPRSGTAARVEASSLPVPEDFEGEFRKQITSSNYLDALRSAAAEASAARRSHP